MTTTHVPAAQLNQIVLVGGNDAPGISLVPDGHGGWHIKRIPGWNPESMHELVNALTVVTAASKLKTPGMSQQAMNSVGQFIHDQVAAHVGAGSVLVVHA